MWRDLATKRLAEVCRVYKLAEEGDLYAVLTLTMEDMASQIVNALKSIEEQESAEKVPSRYISYDRTKSFQRGNIQNLAHVTRDKWVEKGRAVKSNHKQARKHHGRRNFPNETLNRPGKSGRVRPVRAARAVGRHRRMGPTPLRKRTVVFATRSQTRNVTALRARGNRFSTEQRKSNENQPSSPSTRL